MGFWLASWSSFKHDSLTFPRTYALLHASHFVKQNLRFEHHQWVHGKFYLHINQSLGRQVTDTNVGSHEHKK